MKRRISRFKRKKRRDDRGAALLSVLVVSIFLSIIATTMIYVSTQNYQQKLTDYQNKQSFYKAEKALDEFKALLVMDVQEAYKAAYNDTMRNYLKVQEGGNINGKSYGGWEDYYQERYIAELTKIWDDNASAAGGSVLAAIRTAMTGAYGVDDANCFYVPAGKAEPEYGVYENTDGSGKKIFAFRNVRVKYTEGSFTTFLYTDICLELPDFDGASSGGGAPGAVTERETIDLTDYVVYMNWRKADYDQDYMTDDVWTNGTVTP